MEEVFKFAKAIDDDIYLAPQALIDDIMEFCNLGKFADKLLFENIIENQKYLML